MNLFQFWDTEAAPTEVEVLMDTWAKLAGFRYRRYTAVSAADYIEQHFDKRTLSAYLSCAVPAMKADFFRYCALYNEGGVYLDADTCRRADIKSFVAGAKRGMLMIRQGRVANDFLFVRAPRDALLGAVKEQAIKNIEGRVANDVWQVTGPGILTGLYRSEDGKRRFAGFDIVPIRQVKTVVQFKQELDYKSGSRDWRYGMDTGDQASIFSD